MHITVNLGIILNLMIIESMNNITTKKILDKQIKHLPIDSISISKAILGRLKIAQMQ